MKYRVDIDETYEEILKALKKKKVLARLTQAMNKGDTEVTEEEEQIKISL